MLDIHPYSLVLIEKRAGDYALAGRDHQPPARGAYLMAIAIIVHIDKQLQVPLRVETSVDGPAWLQVGRLY